MVRDGRSAEVKPYALPAGMAACLVLNVLLIGRRIHEVLELARVAHLDFNHPARAMGRLVDLQVWGTRQEKGRCQVAGREGRWITS